MILKLRFQTNRKTKDKPEFNDNKVINMTGRNVGGTNQNDRLDIVCVIIVIIYNTLI